MGHTRDAKRRDLQRFLDFYFGTYQHYHPRDVYRASLEEFISWLQQDRGKGTFSEATVARNYKTVRHWLRWAHHSGVCPFPLGCPTDGVKAPPEPEGDWKGLTRAEQLRLLSAARLLRDTTHRGVHQGQRDVTLLELLFGTGLRISELLSCDVWQIAKRKLIKVQRKGGERKDAIMSAEARRSLAEWMQVRGDADGPIFITNTGARLGRKQAWAIIKRVERQANVHLPEDAQLKVHPHALRHTRLRQVAEKEGLPAALRVSGHRSDKYIWTYTTPPTDELEKRLSS